MAGQPRRGRRKSSGGRAARMTAHAAGATTVNPAPPGQSGGAYRPLSATEVAEITATAFRLLSELGMGEVPEALARQCVTQGATMTDAGRLQLPEVLVQRAIDSAARTITFHGRDPARSFTLGGDAVHYGTGGAAVQTLDLDTHLYRPSTLQDLGDFTRLIDTLTNVSWFTRCCIATDVPDIDALDRNTAFALLKGTTKPVGTAFTVAESVGSIVEMFDMALGGAGAFRETPFCKAHISPIISPMRFGEDAVDVTTACIAHGVPISCITAAQSGATAPATPAGFLAQSLAETLAALVMVHVYAPGYPMIFSNWPLVIDLRTGAFAGGGGEIAVMNAASAQISNALGLPSGVACSMSDAKAIDAQMGAEKAMTALAAGLAGGNMIYESSGMTASLLGASFEAFILDDEMLGHVYRAIRGIEVTPETLGYDAICEAVLGEGHFLGGAHTMAAMQRDYFYPELADRDDPRTWAEGGAKDAWQQANTKARDVLATHWPEYLDAEAERDIRKRFDIVFPQRGSEAGA
ncbi:MAG: trimethylamine methyltransferase family protein [Pseudomonadota bacterium]